MRRLLFVPPEQVRTVWPTIRAHVAAIGETCREDWMPEDVFAALTAKSAFLWAVADLSGFLVIQMPETPSGRDLHCWICYNRSGHPPVAYWDELLEIAREHQCRGVTFENDRPGFQRAIPGLRLRYLYRAEVPGGDDGRVEADDDEQPAADGDDDAAAMDDAGRPAEL